MKLTGRFLLFCCAFSIAAHAQIDVNDQHGTLNITPYYNGAPAANIASNMAFRVRVSNTSGYQQDFTPFANNTVSVTLPIGAYTVTTNTVADAFIRQDSVTVSFNQTTNYQPETNNVMATAKGTLNVNGAPPTSGGYTASLNGFSGVPGVSSVEPNTGIFRFFLPASFYAGGIEGPTGNIASLSCFLTAGQEFNFGVIATSTIQNGTLTVEPYYKGAPASTITQRSTFRFRVQGSTGNPLFFDSLANSPVSLQLQPGVYSVTTLTQQDATIRQDSASVSSNTTTTLLPETSVVMGTIRGTVRINGQAPANASYAISLSGLAGSSSASLPVGSGVFKLLLPAGSYTGNISGITGNLQAVNATIAAGQDLDLGIINVNDTPPGVLRIVPYYNGQPAGPAWPATRFNAVITGGSLTAPLSANTFAGLPMELTLAPGVYTVSTRTLADNPIRQDSAVVTSGNVTELHPETNTVMGIVRGTVQVNGSFPTTSGYVFSASGPLGAANSAVTPGTGLFRVFLPAGNYTGSISGPTGTLLSGIPFTVLAGQEVDLGSPGSMSFLPSMTKGGSSPATRTWTISLKNTAPVAFLNTTAKLVITYLSGQTCSAPVIQAPNPVTYGNFASQATLVKTFNIDFTGCAAQGQTNPTRFKAELQMTSGSSAATVVVMPNTTL